MLWGLWIPSCDRSKVILSSAYLLRGIEMKRKDEYRKAKKGFCTFIGFIGFITSIVGVSMQSYVIWFSGLSIASVSLAVRLMYLTE